jgi:hypothetical protein
MKTKKILIIGTAVLLLGSGVFVGVNALLPNISLPGQTVTMTIFDGSESYFDIYLSDVPPGFDVTNGFYVGWCADRTVYMPRGTSLTVRLWNSYDLMLPLPLRDKNWSKVNYILNHEDGATKTDIQGAFWNLLCDTPYSSISPKAQELVDAADGFFIPQSGDFIAILAEPMYNDSHPWPFQFAFLQVRLPQRGCEGLTPGYWKNLKQHEDDWTAPFTPETLIKDVFTNASIYMPVDDTMYDALQYQGGPDEAGAAEILLRAATAGVLNAAHPHIDYSMSLADLINEVNAALGSHDRDTMINLGAIIDDYNNHEADTDLSE